MRLANGGELGWAWQLKLLPRLRLIVRSALLVMMLVLWLIERVMAPL